MAIFQTLICLLGACDPCVQDPVRDPAEALVIATPSPAAPSRSSSAIHLARLLPRNTLAAFALNPVAPHAAELGRTDLPELFASSFGERTERFLQEELARVAGHLRLDPEQIDAICRRGFAVGWNGLDELERPRWLCAFDVGASEPDVRRALEHVREAIAEQGATIEQTSHEGADVCSFRIPGASFLVGHALQDGFLVVGSPVTEVHGALDRIAGRESDSLVDRESYGAFAAQTATETGVNGPLAALFCDPVACLRVGLRWAPAEPREQIEPWLDNLGFDAVASFGMTVTPVDGRVRESMQLAFSKPPNALWRALFPQVEPMRSAVSALVPRDATAFSIAHVDLESLVHEVIALITRAEPSFEQMAQGAFESMRERTGIDFEKELLPSFGKRIATVQWTGTDSSRPFEQAMVFELDDEFAIRRLLETVGVFEASPYGGFFLYEPAPGIRMPLNPGLAVGDGKFVIASSPALAGRLARHFESPTPNPDVAVLIAAAPAGATTIGRYDIGAMLNGVVLNSGVAVPQHVRRVFDTIGRSMGEVRYSVVPDDTGIVFRSESKTGALAGFVGIVFAEAMSDTVDGMLGPDSEWATTSRRRTFERVARLLDRVAEAQYQRKANDLDYGDIDALVGDGLLEAEVVGESVGEGVWRIDDEMLDILLFPDNGPEHFAVVLWPADRQFGDVFVRTDEHGAMRNDLIARSRGIERISARDLFFHGKFGEWNPGWRSLEAARVETGLGERRQRPGDRANYHELLKLEKSQDAQSAGRLVPFLEHRNASIVARACWAVGQRKVTEAVPQLTELATTHPDIEVRRHAMAALTRIRDPRSVEASSVALASDDARLRALAAANLGSLAVDSGTEPLLGCLADRRVDGSSNVDRVQALLALADIGDTAVLLPAATAVDGSDPAENQALAYLFQSLSTRLEPAKEATTMMAILDHESTILRRYAIQRLGELGAENSVTALEGRLGVESEELRPLVEVALVRVRGVSSGSPESTGVREVLERTWQDAQAFWAGIDREHRNYVIGGAVGVLSLLLALMIMRRRRKRRQRAESWASMVNPSEDLYATESYDEYGEESDGAFVEDYGDFEGEYDAEGEESYVGDGAGWSDSDGPR